MRRATKLLIVVFVAVALLIGSNSVARADIYGYQLSVSVNIGDEPALNGSTLAFAKIKGGSFRYSVKAIDPSDPQRKFTVDQWDISLSGADREALSRFSLTNATENTNLYNIFLAASGETLATGETVVFRAKARIGEQVTNEVVFKIFVAADTVAVTPVATASFTPGFSSDAGQLFVPKHESDNSILSYIRGFFPWLLVVFIILTFALLYVILLFRQLHFVYLIENNHGLPGAQIVILNLHSGHAVKVTTDRRGRFWAHLARGEYKIVVAQAGNLNPYKIEKINYHSEFKIVDDGYYFIINNSFEKLKIGVS